MSLWLKSLAKYHRFRYLLGRVAGNAHRAKSQQADFYKAMWTRAADQIGASVLNPFGELLLISRGQQTAKVFRNYTDLDGSVTLRAAGHKPLVSSTLSEVGIPTPPYSSFSISHLEIAYEFLKTHQQCVVKPASGTGAGAGVTTGIQNHRQLHKAAAIAAGFGSELVIEKQIAGDNVRMLYLDGELLDAVQRRAPSVIGDGKSTVAQLVQAENERRKSLGTEAAQVFLQHDLDMRHTLLGQQLSWQSVPAADQKVYLKTVINDNAAADNVSVVNELCESLIEVGRRAAQAIGVRLAGVDLLTSRLDVDLATSGGVILEVNTVPGLYIHKNKTDGEVAVPILEACLQADSATSSAGPWRIEQEDPSTCL